MQSTIFSKFSNFLFFWEFHWNSTILEKSFKNRYSLQMFSRALGQSVRMTSRAVRNSSLKTVVKRHSHDHAGTPQPPYVQRSAPSKSVPNIFLIVYACSFLNMPSWFGKMVLLPKLLLILMFSILALRALWCGFWVAWLFSGVCTKESSSTTLVILRDM